MAARSRFCLDCKNSRLIFGTTYRRCAQAVGTLDKDPALCAVMRRSVTGACGPLATLYEALIEEANG